MQVEATYRLHTLVKRRLCLGAEAAVFCLKMFQCEELSPLCLLTQVLFP